jgi:hypothetical protein
MIAPNDVADIHLRAALPTDAYSVACVYLASRRTFLPYAPIAHDDADVLYELC